MACPDHYLFGRFLGAGTVKGVKTSVCCIKLLAGAFRWPGLSSSLFGPNRLSAYLWPYILVVVPNLCITGVLFFGLAALSRKIFPVYVTSVVLLIGYLIAASLTEKLEWKWAAALIDPFGMYALGYVTEYWTVAERNTLLVPLAGALLWNRVLWLGIAGALFGWTCWRFRTTEIAEERGDRVRRNAEQREDSAVCIPTVTQRDYRAIRLLPSLTWLALRETVKNVYFLVIVLAGVLFTILASRTTGALYGTETYPVTAAVVQIIGASFGMFMLIIITFYAGELVWRERDAGADQIMDVLPIPNWLPLAAKVFALILIQVLLLAIVMVCCMGIQASQGYFHFEPAVYVQELFGIKLVFFALVSVLAIAVQVLVNHKYVGHLVMVVFYLTTVFKEQLGFEHGLYDYGHTPGHVYSDMNGFGHFLAGIAWFNVYWAAAAVLLAILANLFWVRGTDQDFRGRVKLATDRLSPRVLGASVVFGALFAGVGGFIYYNTNILNQFKTEYQSQCESAEYERKYKHLENANQPRVTDVTLAIDVHPERRQARMSGTLMLVNKTEDAIPTIYVSLRPTVMVHRLAVGDFDSPTREDSSVAFYTFTLPEALAPGQSAALAFDIEEANRGFRNRANDTQLVYNGTFFDSSTLPHVGYSRAYELSDDGERRKQGLPPKERMADVNDLAARKNNYISNQADWVALDATVSTSSDQIAIVPGYLRREWNENGRRYFHYQTDGQILDFFSVLSARYEVRHDTWRGPVAFGRSSVATSPAPPDRDKDQANAAGQSSVSRGNRDDLAGNEHDVAIEIYYHKGHEYNVDTMIQAIKDSLEYFTHYFSPYQHRQVRIIEFPRYRAFAQSFPNTIPYSETIGFIARVDPNDPDDIDYPYYVTAHEVAHQWWAHQVISGDVQGATMLSETMAQYSALMVMKRTFGPDQMKRFLRYELDGYLKGRATERKKELPLARVENQGYIHYQKGGLVMYALQDYLGEEKLNAAIAEYVRSVAYQDPPYTNSLELIDYIRRITPAELAYLIVDLFETITLYENRALTAACIELAPDRYEVRLSVAAKKLRVDDQGVESELPLEDFVDIGVLDETGKPLVLEKKRITSSPADFTFELSQRPAKAGIDPLNKLIDRTPDDNTISVKW